MQPQPKMTAPSAQRWRKLGVVFTADTTLPWMQSHTSFPKALVMDERIRVYFCSRDAERRNRIGYFDCALHDPTRVLGRAKEPVLDVGEPGYFDGGGVTASSVNLLEDGRVYLYYHGWEPLQITPHRLEMGLAVSSDGGHIFRKHSNAPLFSRSHEEPILSNNPYVMKESNTWHMWYMTVTRWVPLNGRLEAQHMLRYAHSQDGINWTRDNITCIEPQFDLECNCNASVIKENGLYKMWYCYRSAEDFREGKGAYRMGYAESRDAKQWTRMDDMIDLPPSAEGWDSIMCAYPSVVDADGKRYMFYNGNGFGVSGIGVAVLES